MCLMENLLVHCLCHIIDAGSWNIPSFSGFPVKILITDLYFAGHEAQLKKFVKYGWKNLDNWMLYLFEIEPFQINFERCEKYTFSDEMRELQLLDANGLLIKKYFYY